jgi:hypothetical protein
MPLKTITSFPPGGFTYTQPESKLKFSQLIPLPDQAKLVAAHRKANGYSGATVSEAANDIEEWTCLRLNNDPEYCITDTQKKTAPLRFVSGLVRDVQAVASSVADAVVGARIIYEWWGEGGRPVPQELAQGRADNCIACPNNTVERSWLSGLSETAQEHLQFRSKEKMSVKGEEKLGICVLCSCPMKLKVHTPIELIHEHTLPETIQKLDGVLGLCWVRDELKKFIPKTNE